MWIAVGLAVFMAALIVGTIDVFVRLGQAVFSSLKDWGNSVRQQAEATDASAWKRTFSGTSTAGDRSAFFGTGAGAAAGAAFASGFAWAERSTDDFSHDSADETFTSASGTEDDDTFHREWLVLT